MNSLIEAGQADRSDRQHDLIDAINQVFALFRVNYHNQYYKAFPDTETLNLTKKLWMESLRGQQARGVLAAAELLIRTQDYLPTLSQMLKTCREAAGKDRLPDVHSAYLEACRAGSPKSAWNWSHPIVYHAGRRTGWHLLANTPERQAFPFFREHFQRLENDYLGGKPLPLPEPDAVPEKPGHDPLTRAEAGKRVKALRKLLDS